MLTLHNGFLRPLEPTSELDIFLRTLLPNAKVDNCL